jgi:protein-S-isoprenylcysteine O-methyltransferase Ste14
MNVLLNGYVIAFIVITLIWLIPEVWLIFRDRKIESARGSFNGRFAYFLLISAILLSVLLTIFNFDLIPISENIRLLIGTIIICSGLSIRWWAIYTLGKYFSIVVRAEQDQKIIDYGPYKYVRHPSYTGSLLVCIGFGLGLGNLIGLLIMIILPLAVFMLRAIVEEQFMVSSFGDDYLTYMRKTTMFFPVIH